MKITRKVGSWTFRKLDLLEEYLKAYINATKKARGYGIYYLDIFAGCGKNQHKSSHEVRNGSPLIALGLQPGFHRYFFIEADRQSRDSLQEYVREYPQDVQDRVSIYHGDCNLEIDRVLSELPQKNPTFAFLDPEAADLSWATIDKLAAHKKPPNNKVELFILFPYNMSLVRMLIQDPKAFEAKGYESLVEKVMPPNSDWKQLYRSKLSGRMNQHELRRHFAGEYRKGLESLGYKHVLPPYLVLSQRGHPLYFMFFASDHPAGAKIMSSRFRKPREGEQLSLFEYTERY